VAFTHKQARFTLAPVLRPLLLWVGSVVLDQIRTVDQSRLSNKLAKIDGKTGAALLDVLQEMLAP